LKIKLFLLSRKFYPTENAVTSLSIGFEYPNERSGVFELIEDINKTYGFNIGILSFGDILKLFYNKRINSVEIDLNSIFYLNGKYDD
jgi:MoaA/NifB/PqqE/SkfB family radical SAM enzyme